MTGREAINHYLKTHDTFKTGDVARAMGVTRDAVTFAARKLTREGFLEVCWRDGNWVIYKEVTTIVPPRGNTIFRECLKSQAMRRVLFVYGRREELRA